MRATTSSPSVLLSVLLFHTAAATAQSPLLVTSRFTDQVLAFDAAGNPLGVFAAGGGLLNPVGLTFGPDGNLWVASANTNQVLRFDGTTGAPLGPIASVASPRNLQFGPDGRLYVCSGSTARVLRFDSNGTPLGVFAQGASIGGDTSLTFGPDFNLYVGSVFNNQVVRFDGRTGASLGVFANVGMNGTHDLSFGPDGRLYVSNAFGNDVTVHDGRTGAFLGVFVQDPALNAPLGLTWDERGDLYVANQGGDEVRRYDGRTGALLGVAVTAGSGGLDAPLFCTFARVAGGPRLGAPNPGTAGAVSVFEVAGVAAGGAVALGAGTVLGAIPLPCPGLALGIGDVFLLAAGPADEGGRFRHSLFVPPGVQGFGFLFQAVDATSCAVTPVRAHTF